MLSTLNSCIVSYRIAPYSCLYALYDVIMCAISGVLACVVVVVVLYENSGLD